MHPYVAAAIGRERSAVPAFDRSLTIVGCRRPKRASIDDSTRAGWVAASRRA